MEEHFLKSEKTLTNFLATLSCNGCEFYKDKKCTHEKHIKNEEEKEALRQVFVKMNNNESADNIDNIFCCPNYDKIK